MTGQEHLLNPCAKLDSRLHTGPDPEVVSIIDYKYSVTRVATKVGCYSPFMIWSRCGASGRIFGEGKRWVVGCVYGREFCGCFFGKYVLLDYLDRTLMGRINGCELGSLDGFSLGIF